MYEGLYGNPEGTETRYDQTPPPEDNNVPAPPAMPPVSPAGMALGAGVSAGVGALIGSFVPVIGTGLGAGIGAALSLGAAVVSNYSNYGEAIVGEDDEMAGLGASVPIGAGNIRVQNDFADRVSVKLVENRSGRRLLGANIPSGVTRQLRKRGRYDGTLVRVVYKVAGSPWTDSGAVHRLGHPRTMQTVVLGPGELAGLGARPRARRRAPRRGRGMAPVAAAAPGLRVLFPAVTGRRVYNLELRSQAATRYGTRSTVLSRRVITATRGTTSVSFPGISGRYTITLRSTNGDAIHSQSVDIPRAGKGLMYSIRANSFITARF